MTTSWSRSHLRHTRFTGDAIKSLHGLTKCCWWRNCGTIIRLGLNHRCNLQFGGSVNLVPLTGVIGNIFPAWLYQFMKLHLLLPETLHPVLDHGGNCVHHPAGFIIFAQLARLCIFIVIILILPTLPIIGTCKIAPTISNGVQHLLECCLQVSCCQSRFFNISHIVLLLLNCCLCVCNSHSCHSGISIHIILNSFHLCFIPWTVCFWMFPCRKLCYAPRAGAIFTVKLRLSSFVWWHCRVEHCAHLFICLGEWRNYLFVSIDRCILCWLCWWARCWML